MSNNIYDTSDVRRKLHEIGQERQERIRRQTQNLNRSVNIGMDALKYYNTSNKARTTELLAMETDLGAPIFQTNPEFQSKNMFGRFFTPPKGRVEETLKGVEYLQKNPKLDVSLDAPTTFKESVQKTGEEVAKTSEKAFGSTVGKIGAGLAAGYSAYDLATNWDDKSNVDKTLGTITTALGVGSIFAPGLGIWALGSGLLDSIWN